MYISCKEVPLHGDLFGKGNHNTAFPYGPLSENTRQERSLYLRKCATNGSRYDYFALTAISSISLFLHHLPDNQYEMDTEKAR